MPSPKSIPKAEPREYLVRYGASGTIGRFVSEHKQNEFRRGDHVEVISERGREFGIVLRQTLTSTLPLSLRHVPGRLLRKRDLPLQESIQVWQIHSEAIRLIAFHAWPIQILDVELVAEPACAVIHILLLEEFDIREFTSALSDCIQLPVLIENLGSTEEHGCGSGGCGSGKCSSGGCKSGGSCGSGCGPKAGFDKHWSTFFAEKRAQMEAKKLNIL